ncbi:MAG: type II secretion system secretin GspD [Bryobacteraceae bacterium]
MRLFTSLRRVLPALLATAALWGQAAPPRLAPVVQPPDQAQPPQPPQPQPPQPNAPTTQPQRTTPPLASTGGLMINGESLTQMIDILAGMLKINIIVDPHVNGSVIVRTYGAVNPQMDLMPLLETILRVNGAAMVQVGNAYRIVPVNKVSSLPLEPMVNADPKTLPDDERMVLNLVFLKYTVAAEMDKLIKPFMGEGGSSQPYDPANLLILQDNSRSMKRIMDLIGLFDSDSFAGQRVKLFDVENSRPADLVKDLDNVFKAYAISEKSGAVRFIPVDRINTVIAVAANPGIFEEVDQWIKKLDVAVKIPAGAVNNYVYRLKYGRAETLALAIMALYTGNTMALVGLAAMSNAGGMGGGMMGMMGGMGLGMGGMGMGGMGYGGMGYGGMGYGGMGMGGMGMGGYGNVYGNASTIPYSAQSGGLPVTPTGSIAGNPQGAPSGIGQTGQRLGVAAGATDETGNRIPHVIPNPFDNTLLVQGTPQEWEQISNLVRQLDVPPRQVLIDAKIYELDLTGAFSSGVEAYVDQANTGPFSRALNIASNGGMTLSVGALVLKGKELLTAISLAESKNQAKTIASPSIIATDSIPAVMNVGQSVPVLTSSGVAVTGSSFNSVSSQSTGTTLAITARVNSSGIVTMIIDQQVSQPSATTSSTIDSPSFSTRSFSTQVTVPDGTTIAIGGFIQDSKTLVEQGIPIIQHIPVLGALFGSKSYTDARTELIIFLTPRVIYDTNQVEDATDEIKGSVRKMLKSMQ